MNRLFVSSFLLAAVVSAASSAQSAPPNASPSVPANVPPKAAAPASSSTADPDKPGKPNKGEAYYHYSLAHIYEDLATTYGQTEYANKAIEEYRAATVADPDSEFLNSGLAELYAKTGRIKEAVLEAQDLIQRDPKNLEARKLLGRIYLRSIGDLQQSSQSQNVLKLAIEQYVEIVRLEPTALDNHLLLGRLYRMNNDFLKAEDQFKSSVQMQPTSEEAVISLAYLYSEEGDLKRSTAVLNGFPEAARTGKLYAALGFAYEQQKNYKQAIDAYRKAVALDKDNLDAVRGLAQNLLNDGQTDAALEQFNVIATDNPEDAQTLVRIAEILRKNGKYKEALEQLTKAQTLVPDSVETAYNISLVQSALGHYKEAASVLEDLLTKNERADGEYAASDRSNRALFLERLGGVYRDNGKNAEADATFRKMIPLGDEFALRAYQELIDTYREAKEWNKATEIAREGVTKLPKERGLKLVLASQLADTGQPEEALKTAHAMLNGSPDDREVLIAIAQMNSRLRRWHDAEESLDKADALTAKGDDKQNLTFLRGSFFERQKKYDQAEAMFRKVVEDDPRNASALNYLGYMLADRGMRLEEALGYVRKALELEPANGAFLDSLGWVYFKQGKFDLAEDQLSKAQMQIGSDPTIHEHLGDLYQKTGRLKEAAAQWERSLTEWNKTVAAERDPDDIAKVEKKLESAKVKLAQMSPAKH